jgi:hypothetical protein
MASRDTVSEGTTARPSLWLRCIFWVHAHFFTGPRYDLVRNWIALIAGLLILLAEFTPGIFDTIILVLLLLPFVLVAFVGKAVPIAASAVGWAERLNLFAPDQRVSLVAQVVRLVSGVEDAIEFLIDLVRR